MKPPVIEFQKVRPFSDLLSATFTFLRTNFSLLGRSLLLIAGPVLILTGILSGYFSGNIFGILEAFDPAAFDPQQPDPEVFENMSSLMGSYMGMGFLSLIQWVLLVSIITGYISLYRTHEGPNFGIGDVWRATKSNFGMVIGVSLLGMVLMMVSVFIYAIAAGVVGGIFAVAVGDPIVLAFGLAVYMLITLVLVLWAMHWITLTQVVGTQERRGVFEAFGRAFRLTKGRRWATLGAYLFLVIITALLAGIFSIPSMILTFASGFNMAETTTAVTWVHSLFGVIAALGGLIVVLVYIGVGFQYFSLVERQEAPSLFDKVSVMGEEDA